ncbi:MAG: glyoxalase/bleomycin resistance/extradiol dioxygenase family protein [Proteobacteria bacterium]|nr:MAG: glyoxalase/bleomycin resistance/extradiol dioxygenase family protein [Pseudomonadota bacterium]
MSRQIFVNVPVKDLDKSITFFTALGYTFNPQFTDESGTCMIVSETIYAMLLKNDRFKEFTPLPIADAFKTTEVILALSYDSKQEVSDLIAKALKAGGTRYAEPKDMGFMYQDGFKDLDGHIWEIFWMDPKAING